MKKILNGLVCILLLSSNLIIMGSLAIVIAVLYYVSFRFEFFIACFNFIYRSWVRVNAFCLFKISAIKLDVNYQGKISKKWVVVTCNHLSWADILLLQILLVDKAEPLKFFMKQSLIWVPVVGIVAKMLNYPFVQRYPLSKIKANPKLKLVNQATLKKACLLLKKTPSSLVIFPEGTRLNKEKLARSSYKKLLPPKGKGVLKIFEYWQDLEPNWLDVGLCYQGAGLSLWGLVCGKINKIKVNCEVLEFEQAWLENDFQQIINQRWLIKDQWLCR